MEVVAGFAVGGRVHEIQETEAASGEVVAGSLVGHPVTLISTHVSEEAAAIPRMLTTKNLIRARNTSVDCLKERMRPPALVAAMLPNFRYLMRLKNKMLVRRYHCCRH